MTDPYRLAMAVVGFLVRLFFRDIEVVGRSRIPKSGGGLLIAWHPNGLIDPALIATELPRRVVFGARHGLFSWPILGRLLRALGTVAIYRSIDLKDMPDAERRKANAGSVTALAQAIADGSFAALFPEGVSHDASSLQELKTGAARLYYQAAGLVTDGQAPVIIPVGLHYDKKHLFRSRVLVEFHHPLDLTEDLRAPLPEEPEGRRTRYKELTDEFERVLVETAHATDTWLIHRLMHRARSLVRAERAKRAGADLSPPDMVELSAGFRRIWVGYHEKLKTHPDEVRVLMERVRAYDRDMLTLELKDHELDTGMSLGKRWRPLALVLRALLVYVLGPPVLLIGYVVNGPVFASLQVLSRKLAKANKDEATIKLLGSLVVYPIVWLVASLLVALGAVKMNAVWPDLSTDPVVAGATTFILCAAGGVLALLYYEMLQDTWNALRIRLTRRKQWLTVQYLSLERAALHDDLVGLVQDIDLPGNLLSDGRTFPDR